MPIGGIYRSVVEALEYARTLSSDVRAVYVNIDSATTEQVKKEWDQWGKGLPLVVLESPYRSLMEPLLEIARRSEPPRRSRRDRARRRFPMVVPSNEPDDCRPGLSPCRAHHGHGLDAVGCGGRKTVPTVARSSRSSYRPSASRRQPPSRHHDESSQGSARGRRGPDSGCPGAAAAIERIRSTGLPASRKNKGRIGLVTLQEACIVRVCSVLSGVRTAAGSSRSWNGSAWESVAALLYRRARRQTCASQGGFR